MGLVHSLGKSGMERFMTLSKSMAAFCGAVAFFTVQTVNADQSNLAEQLATYEKTSAKLIKLHHRSIELQIQIERIARQRNEAHRAINKAFLHIDPENTPLNRLAHKVANGLHDADQRYVSSHLNALEARARADHALAENLALETD